MCQRRHAGTSLVGIHATSQAPADRQHHGSAGEATGSSHGGERIPEDHAEDTGNVARELHQHKQAADHIDQRHGRHDFFSKLGNALNAAQQHNRHQDSGNHADNPRRNGEGSIDCFDHGIDLNRGSKHHGASQDHSPDNAQPRPVLAQTAANIPVESSVPVTGLRILFTIGHAQRDLRELHDKAHQSHSPHPEHGAGTTSGNGHGDTSDIAHAKGGRQCRAAGLERRDITLAVALVEDLAEGVLHGVAEDRKLEQSELDGQEQCHRRCQNQQRPAPQPVRDRHHDVNNKHTLPYLPISVSHILILLSSVPRYPWDLYLLPFGIIHSTAYTKSSNFRIAELNFSCWNDVKPFF